MSEDPRRESWHEGPDPQAAAESWLLLDDDELLHRIETLDKDASEDVRLLEVVRSHRHFYIRQEAAKRVRDRESLFAFEDDRHVGQILVRHLTRVEDVTYLERLFAGSRHIEVRQAAQAQLTRLRARLAASPAAASLLGPLEGGAWRVCVIHADQTLREEVAGTLPSSEFSVADFAGGEGALREVEVFNPHLVLADVREVTDNPGLAAGIRGLPRYVPLVVLCPAEGTARLVEVLGTAADEFLTVPFAPALLTAKLRALVHFAHRSAARLGVGGTPGPSTRDAPPAAPPAPRAARAPAAAPPRGKSKAPAPGPADGVDATLLGWAVYFVVEQVWAILGTVPTAGLLRRTHLDTRREHPVLDSFSVDDKARVEVTLSGGARLPRRATAAVAAWMAEFLGDGGVAEEEIREIDVRKATSPMADALDQAGFYSALDAAAAARAAGGRRAPRGVR
jgi:CheY-like chemotaxis protein